VRARLLLALASLAVSLVACELALRWMFVAAVPLGAQSPLGLRVAGADVRVHQREYDTWHRYNRFAFRDDDLVAPAAADEARVLVLGDSFAEGLGVDADARFSSLLVDRLRPLWPARRVRAINAGQIGTAPGDYLQNLADFGVALRPAAVVVTVYAGNDFVNGAALARWRRPVQETLPPDAAAAPSWLFGYVGRAAALVGGDRTALVRRLHGAQLWPLVFGGPIDADRYRVLLASLGVSDAEIEAATRPMDPALVADFHAGLVNPATLLEAIGARVAAARGERPSKLMTARYADVRGLARAFVRARDVLAAHDARLVVLVVPDVHDVMPAAHTAFLRRLAVSPNVRMRAAARLGRKLVAVLTRKGITVADPRAGLVDASEPTYHVMDGHLNAAGHRIVADVVARALGA
jgi:lysophospholipase L1-like esterase